MDKDINRIKVVLAEKGGAARLLSVSWRDTKEPINGWQSNRGVRLQLNQSGVPMIASQQWRHI
jgi:phosphoribosylformimino-5-aminoimidazole carboxamide ribonucleotide (ProFAR) isomerase